MKKSYFLLTAVLTLCLTACGGNSSKNNSKDNSDEGLKYKPTMEIAFEELESNVMVDPEIKNYIDVMEEQEKTLEKPYHFSSLYGPTDYAMLAAKDKSRSYGNEGKTYPASETGGVDACQYLGNHSKDINVPIVVKWDTDGYEYEEDAKALFWSEDDFSDLREVPVTVDEDGIASASLDNLFRATKYKMQFYDGVDASQAFEFETADYPRFLSCRPVRNVRDIGGFETSYGVRTKQGLLYRGYYIDDKSGGHGVNYDENVDKVQKEVMKIGFELDLQKTSETNGRTASCLEGADYKCLTLVSYDDFLKESSYQNLPEVFDILANAEEKHVYFHCWGGADRTGMLAFFINAICGVSYTDLIEDFEITSESNNIRCHMHNSDSSAYSRFLNAFVNEWDGYDAEKTVNENCEKWLLEVPKINPEVILKIREMMIPGYYDGMPQNIPTYTPSSDVQEDANGSWNPAVEDSNVKCNYQRKN